MKNIANLHLDLTVEGGEVLAAVRNAITISNDGSSAVAETERAVVTEPWAAKNGTQIVTVRMVVGCAGHAEGS